MWSSDLVARRQTAARVAAEAGLEPVLDPRLREFDIGPNRTGLTSEQYAAAHPEEHAALLAGDDRWRSPAARPTTTCWRASCPR